MPTVIALHELTEHDLPRAGGKAVGLGRLARLEGVRVPPGVCVTTDAFDAAGQLLAEAEQELRAALDRLGDGPVAVRSSATGEDRPDTSSAGQHDSFLDVRGADAVVEHVRRCRASLTTARAVAYRGPGAPGAMAVVVQRMVAADVSGVLFTADPVSGNRHVTAIEATRGLGEALVAGHVAPDRLTLRDARVLTAERPQGVLADEQAIALETLGRRIEAAFGAPQDVEWCLAGGEVHVVQSRPITTLFPIPEAAGDGPRVYVSVGHQQMMTDAMRPLGLSLWQRTTPRPMAEAGSRLFVDVTAALATPGMREATIAMLGRADPLLGDALQQVADRGLVPEAPAPAGPSPPAPPSPPATNPDPALVEALMALSEASAAASRRPPEDRTGTYPLAALAEDLDAGRRVLFDPEGLQAITAGMDAAAWLDEHLGAWLGERGAADVLTRSVDHNVTSQMGLALLDVADAVRPHPEAVALLERVAADGLDGEDLLDALAQVPGGAAAAGALRAFLDRYGMRCAGEIDVTRPRWVEEPETLVPALLSDVHGFAAGEAARRFEEGRRAALAYRDDVLERLRGLPDGERKAAEVARMVEVVRTYAGYREHPKHGMVSRMLVHRRALLAEADRLVAAGVLDAREDVHLLRLEELAEVVRDGRVDRGLLREREAAFRHHERLVPPRVLTSEGEGLHGAHRREGLPEGALPGLAACAGVVEGRARIVLDLAGARLEPGDVLVTRFTDPSWTPLFVAAAGLVTEVGGRMTHGAVVAREYGLPAVVGVPGATACIADGQRVRVHGTDGYVELLDAG